MSKRPNWLPRGLQELAAWFNNFQLKFAQLADGLNFTPAQIAAVAADNAMVQYMAQADIAMSNDDRALREFRDTILFEPIGSTTPSPPVFVMPPLPAPVNTGIVERLTNLADRIKLANGYTDEIGAQLGIVSTGESGDGTHAPSMEDLKPDLKIRALPASQIEARFVRGKSDGIVLQIQRQGESAWTNFNNYYQSSAVLTVTPKTPNAPEQLLVRARYLSGNDQIGDFSDIVTIVTTP